MPRVTLRPLARADILDIWAHIADDSLTEADRWVDRPDVQCAPWATQPLIGRPQQVGAGDSQHPVWPLRGLF